MRWILGLLKSAIVITSCLATAVWSQTYPDKPVTLVVGFPAGGGTDIVARKVAMPLGQGWNQPVVIDNKGGAAGTIATTQVARAAPNGYTIFMATMGNMTLNPHLYPMPIDPVKELTPITNVVGVNFVLVTRPNLGVNTVEELVAMARKSPGALNYSSSGIGGAPHLAVELLSHMSGARFTHVVYKGSAPSIADLLSGQVDFTMDSLVQVLPLIKSGKLKAELLARFHQTDLRGERRASTPSKEQGGDHGAEFAHQALEGVPAGCADGGIRAAERFGGGGAEQQVMRNAHQAGSAAGTWAFSRAAASRTA